MKNFLKFKTIDKVIYVINCILIGMGLGLIYQGILHFMGYDIFTPLTVSVLAVSYGVLIVFESIYTILRLFKLNKNQSNKTRLPNRLPKSVPIRHIAGEKSRKAPAPSEPISRPQKKMEINKGEKVDD